MTDVKTGLAFLGWRVDTTARLEQAIKDFQRAWNLGPALVADGDPGPATRAALETSLARRAQRLPDLSANFSAREFACECDGKWADCQRIWVNRAVIRIAEQYRDLVGPFSPVRACRCPRENARVGGVSNSQHLYGLALDLPLYAITAAQVQKLGTVSGIGVYLWNGRRYVRHVDARHLRGSTSTPTRPATWDYGTAKTAPLAPAPVKATAPTPTPPTSEEDDMFTDEDRVLLKYSKTQHEANARSIATLSNTVTSELTALKATVGVLANSQGLDPNLVQKTISDAVSAALSKITLTTEETP